MTTRSLAALCTLALCAGPAAAGNLRFLPMREPAGASTPAGVGLAEAKSAVGARNQAQVSHHLAYHGGAVVSSLKIVAVLWGSGVDSKVASTIGGFYADFTAAPMFDWLSEYDTTAAALGGSSGSDQHIGHGSFAGTTTIAPAHTATTLDDSDITAELQAQLAAGHLPPADANTLYVIHFPPGVKITAGSMNSCSSGGFCAYHSSIWNAAGNIRYAVVPDESNLLSGCNWGCGPILNSSFDNTCVSASHEIVETVTDPDPGSGWFEDGVEGEIGDLCNHDETQFLGNDGKVFHEQKEWSNLDQACIAVRTPDGFSAALTPATIAVQAGASATFTLTTAVTHGQAKPLALTLGSLPSNVVGSFDTTSLVAGQSAHLTLTAGPSAPNGAISFAITAESAAQVHEIDGTLQVSGGSGGQACSAGTVSVAGVCVPTGCDTASAPATWGLVGLLAFGLRRRRVARGATPPSPPPPAPGR